ncbi:MAG TPA: hypothetical protein VD788_10000, partial [Candidatus Polarisedimenticolaceae bacterium]|nr:hypothetical protein [Candidatus Polarisedimenticolaceae bacterium]
MTIRQPEDLASANAEPIPIDAPQAFANRELSWLAFARRVLFMVEDDELPLLERAKFVGIMGMLHYEFYSKRVSGLKRQIKEKPNRLSVDGRTPAQELADCRAEVVRQVEVLNRVVETEILPGLAAAGLPILRWHRLRPEQRTRMLHYFERSVRPILIPLAVDAEHPFPFISNLGLNLAALVPDPQGGPHRFVRTKVPVNRPRWVPLGDGEGWVPLEEIIKANLHRLFPGAPPVSVYAFRVTRGAEGSSRVAADATDTEVFEEPGSIVRQVSAELKARRFAGVVRLQVEQAMPADLRKWLGEQLGVDAGDV